VPAYPEAADEPAVSTANSSGPPLAVTVIQSAPPGRSVAAYRTWIAETIIPQLERIRGVASIRHIGGRELEVHVDFDPAALAARGLTVQHVARAVRGELRDVSGGDIPMGKRLTACVATVLQDHLDRAPEPSPTRARSTGTKKAKKKARKKAAAKK